MPTDKRDDFQTIEAFPGNAIRFSKKRGWQNEMLFTVGEVCRITGLSRKLLFDYKDLLPPAAYSSRGYEDRRGVQYDGYGLYDTDTLRVFTKIGILREIALSRSEIKKALLENRNFDDLLEAQIKSILLQRKQLEKRRLLAEKVKETGLELLVEKIVKEKFHEEKSGQKENTDRSAGTAGIVCGGENEE